MAATHCEEDEFILSHFPPFMEPTPEYDGFCGDCMGSGEEAEYHEMTGRLLGYNECPRCGGDGLSVLVKKEDT